MTFDPLFDVSGRGALVTGASSGLGEHFAKALAARGATVIAAARRADRLDRLVETIRAAGGTAHAVSLDVTSHASVKAAVGQAADLAGRLDIVVNNAGVADTHPSLTLPEENWRRVLDTNLDGAWRVAQASAQAMVAAGHGGSLINIASVLGLRVANQLLAYSAAKAALIHVTQALALEWSRHGIRVNAIAPGYVETEINSGFFKSEAGQLMVKRIPQRRIGTPRDLEGALLLLASDAGAYMTGAVVVADGGHLVNSL